MEYVGLQTQIWRNNFKSILLLIGFPILLFVLTYLFFFILSASEVDQDIFSMFPLIIVAVFIWFLIAWFSHSAMIRKATSSMPLERKKNLRVYNLVENLCISQGVSIPKIYVIPDSSLNAFASGINEKTYAISLSQGIIDKLNDNELEAVIAHELTHIQNKDDRLLIISIIFVGVFSFVSEIAFKSLTRFRVRGGKNKGASIGVIALLLVLGGVGYLVSLLFKFSLSRKREYMADAGASNMTKNPKALANALRKISEDPWIEAVKREDVAQLFIDHPTKRKKEGFGTFFKSLFATHPPIEKRIEVLEQF